MGADTCLSAGIPALADLPLVLLPQACRGDNCSVDRYLVPQRAVRRTGIAEQRGSYREARRGRDFRALDEAEHGQSNNLVGGFLCTFPEWVERPRGIVTIW